MFHGPKYFGVGAEDLGIKSSQLVDTCSFTRLIADRLFGYEEHQSPFIMAIAGYGAGKSHLALTLGALFSGHDPETSRQILANLRDADADIGHEIKNSLSKPNLVIALNGMRDFNLNYSPQRTEVFGTAWPGRLTPKGINQSTRNRGSFPGAALRAPRGVFRGRGGRQVSEHSSVSAFRRPAPVTTNDR